MVNCGPLSVFICFGRLNLANASVKQFNVCVTLVFCSINISTHFECASITTARTFYRKAVPRSLLAIVPKVCLATVTLISLFYGLSLIAQQITCFQITYNYQYSATKYTSELEFACALCPCGCSEALGVLLVMSVSV